MFASLRVQVLDPGVHISFFFSFWIAVLGILCSCVSIIRIHMKYRNRCQNRDFFLSRSHFGRDTGFQAKSGKSRRDRVGYSNTTEFRTRPRHCGITAHFREMPCTTISVRGPKGTKKDKKPVTKRT